MRVQFGAGGNILQGWKNHDLDSDGVDIRKRLPYDDASVEFVLAEHVCEHTDGREGFLFFEECHRILKPGGVARICVPHLDRITDLAHCRDLIVGHGHQMVYNLSNLVTMLQVAGFETVTETGRKDCDGHHRVIGEAKDDLETLRVEAKK